MCTSREGRSLGFPEAIKAFRVRSSFQRYWRFDSVSSSAHDHESLARVTCLCCLLWFVRGSVVFVVLIGGLLLCWGCRLLRGVASVWYGAVLLRIVRFRGWCNPEHLEPIKKQAAILWSVVARQGMRKQPSSKTTGRNIFLGFKSWQGSPSMFVGLEPMISVVDPTVANFDVCLSLPPNMLRLDLSFCFLFFLKKNWCRL